MKHLLQQGTSGLLGLFGVTMLVACGGQQPATETTAAADPATTPQAAPVVVYAVNYPLAYFAERIGGDRVEVVLPVPAGVDPADWAPDAATVAAFQGADLILLNGAGYAGWIDKVALPPSRLVDTSAGIGDRLLPLEDPTTHTHGPGGEHSHEGWAFTLWLDPGLAVAQAEAVRVALTAADPEGSELFQAGFERLRGDLDGLEAALAAAVAEAPERPVLFSHPVYQYLVGRYGLNARSVHWEPEESPGAEDWEVLTELLAEHRARWMIWEGQPLPATAEGLAALGVGVAIFDPGANRPESGDYLSLMAANAAELARVFADPE